MVRSTKWAAKPTEKGCIGLKEKLEAIARRYRNDGMKKPKGVSAPTSGTADTNPPNSSTPTSSKKRAHDDNEDHPEHSKKTARKEQPTPCANDTEALDCNSDTDGGELNETAMPASDVLSVYPHFKMIISELIEQLART